MTKFLIGYAIVVCAVCFAGASAAEGKARKPVVCVRYSIAKTDRANDDAVAICYDGKKPRLFYRFEEKEIPGAEAGRVKVVVGWP
jgi:hypothetical protein